MKGRKNLFERLGRAVQSLVKRKRIKQAEKVVFAWYEKYGHERARKRERKTTPNRS